MSVASRAKAKAKSRPAGPLLATAAAGLAKVGVEAPGREARSMLGQVLAVTPQRLFAYPETPVTVDQARAFEGLIGRRLAGEPLSRILGRREFWSLTFRLGPETLDPRPDSETLVQAVIDRVAERSAPIRVLDLGTGSGCLLLAVLTELPGAWGLGIDLSPGALDAAAANAHALGLAERAQFLCTDWDSGLIPAQESAGWDVIISNPPYIARAAFGDLHRSVTDYDPRPALDGGEDGYYAYRRLIPAIARQLAPTGFVVVELGIGQAEGVAALAARAGLASFDQVDDLSGRARALVFRHREPR